MRVCALPSVEPNYRAIIGISLEGGTIRDTVAAPFAEILRSSAANRGFRARGLQAQGYLDQMVHRLRDSIALNNQ